MNSGKRITVLAGVFTFGLAVWAFPVLFGAEDAQRWEHRRDVGRLAADVWNIEEGANGRVVWVGTWTRRVRSDVFDAVWRNMDNGVEVRDRIRLVEARDRIIFHRDGTNGEYTGQLSRDGNHMEGTASWYGPGGFWRANAVWPNH